MSLLIIAYIHATNNSTMTAFICASATYLMSPAKMNRNKQVGAPSVPSAFIANSGE
jgi:hypothetical protein